MANKKKSGGKRPHNYIFGIVVGVLLLSVAAVYAYLLFRPLRAALVGLDAAETKAIERVLTESKLRLVLSEIPAGDLAKTLAAPLPPDLVFARSGLELNRSRAELENLPAALVKRVPQSLSWAVSERDETRSLPLLVDHFELAWRFERWASLKLKEPRTRADFEKAAATLTTPQSPAILFAGGDGETLLLVLSVLCVAQKGTGAYRSSVSAIIDWAREARKKGASIPPISELLAQNPALADAVAELRRWKTAGRLHIEWDRLLAKDVRSYMESGMGNLVLQSLSFHRTVPYAVIGDYRAYPFPRFAVTDRPALVTPMTTVSVTRRGWRVGRALEAVDRFAQPRAGFLLAETSGRATALSAAQAPDIQAADVLSWAAAHRNIVSGFYRDAFYESAAAESFAAALREALR